MEKPVDADDHNIYIYYPISAGGGSKRLFRKIEDKSAEFYPHINEIRREGSYIYEEFVTTQGTDVKVYTVGPEYGHAEARKSPVVDGRVKRDSEGREVRYPVILSHAEKDIARKIVETFRQTVCGFDILRVHGKSYCCDVNGFSFVKNSRKYYEDAAQILTEIMLNNLRQEYAYQMPPAVRRIPSPALSSLPSASGKLRVARESSSGNVDGAPQTNVLDVSNSGRAHVINVLEAEENPNYRPPSPSPSVISEYGEYGGNNHRFFHNQRRYETEELRCVIAIIRHGDRTPKQKIKVVLSEQRYLDYFHSYAKTPKKDLKVKSKSGLVKFLEVTREIIQDGGSSSEMRRKLCQLRDVLERWEISGINRKLQMKPQKWDEDEEIMVEEEVPAAGESAVDGTQTSEANGEGGQSQDVATSSTSPSLQKMSPVLKKVVTKKGTGLATELLVILKWGGDLTPLGREQAEKLGERFRNENYPDHDNGGVLRLHATYRHDLKIKASDEGRVMKTAAAFTKGLLELEGQLTPILASLVTVEEKNRTMLDRGGNFEMKEEMDRCKKHLNLLQVDQELSDELIEQIVPGCAETTRAAFRQLGNPLQSLKRMHFLIGKVTTQLEFICARREESASRLEGLVDDMLVMTDYVLPYAPSSSLSAPSPLALNTVGMHSPVASHTHISGLSTNASQGVVAPKPGIAAVYDDQTVGLGDGAEGGDDLVLATNLNVDVENNGQSGKDENGNEVVAVSEGDLSPLVRDAHSSLLVERPLSGIMLSADQQTTLNEEDAGFLAALYLNETFDLMLDRWEKLYKDFYSSKSNSYDLTKLPDVFDMIRYDILHNQHLNLSGMDELYELSRRFELCVVPQEYGMDSADKRYIGSKMCGALIEKIKHDLTASADINSTSHKDEAMLFQLDHSHAEDLRINSISRVVRTRLYFTSESHLHTVLNVFRYAKPGSAFSFSKEALEKLDQINNVSYLSQIVIRLFEDRFEPGKFSCEVSFSSGSTQHDPIVFNTTTLQLNSPYLLAPYVDIDRSMSLPQLLGCLDDAIELYHSTDKHTNALGAVTPAFSEDPQDHNKLRASAATPTGNNQTSGGGNEGLSPEYQSLQDSTKIGVITPPSGSKDTKNTLSSSSHGKQSSQQSQSSSLTPLSTTGSASKALGSGSTEKVLEDHTAVVVLDSAQSTPIKVKATGEGSGQKLRPIPFAMPSPSANMRRNSSVTVNMEDASDRWEQIEQQPLHHQQQAALQRLSAAKRDSLYRMRHHQLLLQRRASLSAATGLSIGGTAGSAMTAPPGVPLRIPAKRAASMNNNNGGLLVEERIASLQSDVVSPNSAATATTVSSPSCDTSPLTSSAPASLPAAHSDGDLPALLELANQQHQVAVHTQHNSSTNKLLEVEQEMLAAAAEDAALQQHVQQQQKHDRDRATSELGLFSSGLEALLLQQPVEVVEDAGGTIVSLHPDSLAEGFTLSNQGPIVSRVVTQRSLSEGGCGVGTDTQKQLLYAATLASSPQHLNAPIAVPTATEVQSVPPSSTTATAAATDNEE